MIRFLHFIYISNDEEFKSRICHFNPRGIMVKRYLEIP